MSFARAVPIALLLALAAPAAARADATIAIDGTAPHKTLTFTVNDTLDHDVDVEVVNGELEITDSAGIGSGCTPVSSMRVNCEAVEDVELLVFAFGGGDDDLDVGSAAVPVTADGGEGDDVLRGGPLADELLGGLGDDGLHGGPGTDYLEGDDGVDTFDGGFGDDELAAAEPSGTADASIACGAGDDGVLDYDDADVIDADCELIGPPLFDGPVSIGGNAWVGYILTAMPPSNVGGDGLEYFQWERCDAAGSACTDIAGAGARGYTLTAADLGQRIRVRYTVANALGEDVARSEATAPVGVASPWTSWPPRVPRPPRPRVTVPTLVIPPFVSVRKPYFSLPNGDPVVDTGRTVLCPGTTGGTPCRLKVKARPSGASARWRGRPASAGEASVLVAGGKPVRVRVPLNLRAYRLLRAHRKLTLTVTATMTRWHSAPVHTTFTMTVKLPKRR